MKDKKYFIDNEPASAEDIINMARDLDSQFDESHFYQTSVAANILRQNGHIVN
jgi:hypothetical protein